MTNRFFTYLITGLVFMLAAGTATAQQDYNLTGGNGTPEMVNLGLRMRVDQNQYGLSIGTNLAYKNQNFNVSADYYYHFAGNSGHTSLRPWFIKSGLTFLSSEGEWEKRTNLLFVPRLGREFNFTSEFGLALEVGLMLMLMDQNKAKKTRTDEITGDLDVIGTDFLQPSAGLKIFYRLF